MSIYHEAKGSPALKAVIVVLFGILIYILYEPYAIREEEENFKRESRSRMMNIRTAQLLHISERGRYASSIDSLVSYIQLKLNSTAPPPPETFKPLHMSPFAPESLLHAPKSHRKYVVVAVDTTVIKKYVVEDPDGYGSIGSLTDDTRVNKASWEE